MQNGRGAEKKDEEACSFLNLKKNGACYGLDVNWRCELEREDVMKV